MPSTAPWFSIPSASDTTSSCMLFCSFPAMLTRGVPSLVIEVNTIDVGSPRKLEFLPLRSSVLSGESGLHYSAYVLLTRFLNTAGLHPLLMCRAADAWRLGVLSSSRGAVCRKYLGMGARSFAGPLRCCRARVPPRRPALVMCACNVAAVIACDVLAPAAGHLWVCESETPACGHLRPLPRAAGEGQGCSSEHPNPTRRP